MRFFRILFNAEKRKCNCKVAHKLVYEDGEESSKTPDIFLSNSFYKNTYIYKEVKLESDVSFK